jgi:dihydroxy-acid dehydratase
MRGGHLHGDALTITGRTLAEELAASPKADGEIVHRFDAPLSPNGGLAILKGNLCPDGAVLKTAGLKTMRHRGPARVFESEEAANTPSPTGYTSWGTLSSFATRARAADPACAKCSASLPSSTVRATARRLR